MNISEKTTVKELNAIMGDVWTWRPPEYNKPLEEPQLKYCCGITFNGSDAIVLLSGGDTEYATYVYLTKADANAAFNAHLDKLRLEE